MASLISHVMQKKKVETWEDEVENRETYLGRLK